MTTELTTHPQTQPANQCCGSFFASPCFWIASVLIGSRFIAWAANGTPVPTHTLIFAVVIAGCIAWDIIASRTQRSADAR